MSLANVSYRSGKLEYPSRHATEPEWALEGYLEAAKRIVEQAMLDYAQMPHIADPSLNVDFEHLRWFPLPGEILRELKGEAAPDQGAHSIKMNKKD
jgi:hypothetical protein